MTTEKVQDSAEPTGAASALSAGLERLTIASLRRWGEALNDEQPRSLGERLIQYADSWAAAIEAEREACAKIADEKDDMMQYGAGEEIRMRSNVKLRGDQQRTQNDE